MKSTVKLLQYQLVIGTEAVIMLQSTTKKRKSLMISLINMPFLYSLTLTAIIYIPREDGVPVINPVEELIFIGGFEVIG